MVYATLEGHYTGQDRAGEGFELGGSVGAGRLTDALAPRSYLQAAKEDRRGVLPEFSRRNYLRASLGLAMASLSDLASPDQQPMAAGADGQHLAPPGGGVLRVALAGGQREADSRGVATEGAGSHGGSMAPTVPDLDPQGVTVATSYV